MENYDKKSINSRLFDGSLGGYVQHPGYNSRSYTAKEMESITTLKTFKLFKQIDGEQLVLRNKPKNKYYIIQNGVIFKYDEETFSFYKLNLNDFVWESDQTLASIYYDTYLKFQELTSFEDYYPDREELDLSKRNGK